MMQSVEQRFAQLYDASVPDWPGEIDFYRARAARAKRDGLAVLEVACGTGRVALQLARDGIRVVGFDLSPEMLDVAREKGAGMPNVRWVQADMRSFDLGETFGLASSLACFPEPADPRGPGGLPGVHRAPSRPDGVLVVHLDHQSGGNLGWLGAFPKRKRAFLDRPGVRHPETGRLLRVSRAWAYEASSQTASVVTAWEEVNADGKVVDLWQRGPIALHCVFRFEMEHLLARVGLAVEGLYGDFSQGNLEDDSSEMVWLVRK